MARLPIQLAAPMPGDEEILTWWSAVHLRDCENWLVRRSLLGPADGQTVAPNPLRELRRRHAISACDPLPAALANLRLRRVGEQRTSLLDDALAGLVGQLETDLGLYGPSLRAGGIDNLTVTPLTGIVSTLYLFDYHELFLPCWLTSYVSSILFPPTSTFAEPPRVTLSWLVFQSLVLLTDRRPIPTTATFLGIRESD